jgi:hypothetical protein
MKSAKRTVDTHNDPIHLFLHFRKISKDPTKSEIQRARARNDAMDCWNLIPWGLAADVLDMEQTQ